MNTPRRRLGILAATAALVAVAALAACQPAPHYDELDRLTLNRLAVRANLPLYWVADHDDDGAVDAEELAALRFYPSEGLWVEGGELTAAFEEAYATLRALAEGETPEGLDSGELERRRLVAAELDHGIPTLVATDLRGLPADHRAFARHMLAAGSLIDTLYARHTGAEALAAQLPDDAASRSLFRRNWGPACVAPKTQNEAACTAIPGAPRPVFDLYPAALQARDGFCEELEAAPKAKKLLDPFTVVRESESGELVAVPYTEAYAGEMGAIAAELEAASAALEDPAEDALRAYLGAAAKAFRDNDWEPADEAWSRMNAHNSRWYLRIGPDEVYWEPCAAKAGLHMTFALINTASLEWEEKLLPVRQEMEDAVAALIGAPYEARQVSFHLPDFIDIVVNAGDDRDPLGATIGQSLPNWGPVANEGRGRTVAMSNLYTDWDSLEIQREQVRSLFTEGAMAHHTTDAAPGLFATILHEAMHNFGPAHEYEVGGKTDNEIFGGPLASTMEELKAQTGGLWYVEWLRARGIITGELANQTYLDSLRWAMDHASRGMVTASGRPKAYSQLAAIQLGFFLETGALGFDAEALAANGTDKGAFTVDFAALPGAIDTLMRDVGRIKARGDKKGAEALRAKYVEGDIVPFALIEERILRHPKASFVYAVELP